MFKFFRSIRQNLINENKTAKYLKYAVGEIVLVMVGILLALQVNTWNQNRLLRIEEKEVIKRLLIDFEADVTSVEAVIRHLEIKRTSLLRLKTVFVEGMVSDAKLFLGDILLGTHRSRTQGRVNRSTYNDLIGSGKLGIIKNPDIRTQIADYYEQIRVRDERMERTGTQYWEYAYQLVPSNPSSVRIPDLNLSEEQIEEIIRQVLESPIKNLVTAELNFGQQVQINSDLRKVLAEKLIEVLKTYQAEIQK